VYYRLLVNDFVEPGPYRTRPIAAGKFDDTPWLVGKLLTPAERPTAPLRFELWAYSDGQTGVAELLDDIIPLMRNDLVARLKAAGVDNLETFPAVLTDPARPNAVIDDYRAVNIVGLVKCADLDASEYDDFAGAGIVTLGFNKLIIDDRKAGGALMFRLAEAVTTVVVHQRVKDALPANDFPYLLFRSLSETRVP
jgi:hypothetical protein